MKNHFSRVGIIGRNRPDLQINDTLEQLQAFLLNENVDVILDKETSQQMGATSLLIEERETLAKHCDLVIVVGGDGSLLNAARAIAKFNVPLVGINRGQLGFLTDISPHEMEQKISEILQGQYKKEKRFLITTHIYQADGQEIGRGEALNDVVLLPGAIAHMIEFEININNRFVTRQKADGLIVATPTGSTAYALSGGGPILHPELDALVLVPMFPHTLSHRPLVIAGDSEIDIVIAKHTEAAPKVSCDGHRSIEVLLGGRIHIRKDNTPVEIIHPLSYDYYETLRTKLGWV